MSIEQAQWVYDNQCPDNEHHECADCPEVIEDDKVFCETCEQDYKEGKK